MRCLRDVWGCNFQNIYGYVRLEHGAKARNVIGMDLDTADIGVRYRQTYTEI